MITSYLIRKTEVSSVPRQEQAIQVHWIPLNQGETQKYQRLKKVSMEIICKYADKRRDWYPGDQLFIHSTYQ